jgi:hypothetical protein
MARPLLTPHEAFLLNAIRTQDRSTLKIAMWSYLISAGAIAAWGVAINEMVIVFIAFFYRGRLSDPRGAEPRSLDSRLAVTD